MGPCFRSGRTVADFTAGLLGVPAAGVSLPVPVFLLLSVYGRLPRMAAGTAVLGAGRIGIHLQHRQSVRKDV